MKLHTKSGLEIATGHLRVVYGGKGNYVEISPQQIIMDNLHVPENQQWRFHDDWCDKIYYEEYRTNDTCNVKVYHQVKGVNYADYKVGFYYVSVDDFLEVLKFL